MELLAEFANPLDAQMARARLAAAGIESLVFDGGMASLGLGFMTPARLMVDPDDAPLARRVLGEDGAPCA